MDISVREFQLHASKYLKLLATEDIVLTQYNLPVAKLTKVLTNKIYAPDDSSVKESSYFNPQPKLGKKKWEEVNNMRKVLSVVILLLPLLLVAPVGAEEDVLPDLCTNIDGVQEDYGSGSTELIQIDEEGNCGLLEEVYPDIRERQDNPNFVEPSTILEKESCT